MVERKKAVQTRFFLFSLISAWCIGIGLRVLLAGERVYLPNLFDKFFDWGGLFLLGVVMLVYTVYDFNRQYGREGK